VIGLAEISIETGGSAKRDGCAATGIVAMVKATKSAANARGLGQNLRSSGVENSKQPLREFSMRTPRNTQSMPYPTLKRA
jgi:hypothetical protein